MSDHKVITTDDVAAEWDRAAATRDRQIETGLDDSAINVLGPTVVGLLNTADRRQVLDVGCGTGWLSERIAKASDHVFGIDPSAGSLQIANAKHGRPNIRYEAVTVENFAHSHEAEFTAAIANMVLSTCVDLRGALTAVARLLQERAVFVFSIPHPAFFAAYWGYDTALWYDYEQERPITAPFRIHAETTQLTTTHFHRSLETYLNETIASGFRIDEIREMRGRGFQLPRFLVARVTKTS